MSNKWKIALCGLAAALAITLLALWVVRLNRQLHVTPEPVVVTDTITNWQYDTVWFDSIKIVKLPIHDTTVCVDSVYSTDSVFVEVPMYKYIYDTTLKTEHSTTRLQATMSGYDVNIDTLAVSTTVTPIVVKETIPWYKRFRPSVGVGVGTTFKGEATVGVYAGVGYLF